MLFTYPCLLSLLALQTSIPAKYGQEQARPFIIGVSLPLHQLEVTLMPKKADAKVQPLEDLIESVSGEPADLQLGKPQTLLTKLNSGDIHLAIMPGIEYAWFAKIAPTAVPLVTVGKQNVRLRACLLMKADAAFSSIDDLKDKTIAFPTRNEYYVYLFVQHLITKTGGEARHFFKTRLKPADTDAAIEAVLNDEAQAVFLNEQAWQVYEARKPERAKKLKVAAKSPAFPAPVALYNPGVLTEKQVARLREELCTARENPLSRQMLNCYRIEGFTVYSSEYEQVVQDIIKEFPKPVRLVSFFKHTVDRSGSAK